MLDHRVSFADPVAVRHALEILSELATKDPQGVAIALGDLIGLTLIIFPLSHENYFIFAK